jgi:cytochrome b involved in lipid metabolism
MAEKKVYSLQDCKKHVSDKDCWLVVHGKAP